MANLIPKYESRENGERYVKSYSTEFYDPTRRPKRKRITLRTKDKVAALQRHTALERKWARGEFDPWTDSVYHGEALTVGAAADRFVDSRRAHCSQARISGYRYVLHHFARTLAADLPLNAVDESHIQAYLSRDMADATRRSYSDLLRIFFKWCLDAGLSKHNPVPKLKVSKSSRRRDLPEFLSKDQFERLIITIKSDAILKPELAHGSQWLVDAINVAVHTGLRRGELCSLKWRSVDLDGNLLTVANLDGFTTKSGRERRVPLVGLARQTLLDLNATRSSEDGNDFVFKGASGRRINDGYLSKRFRYYRRMTRLPDDINFHSLRHTFASWAVMRGMDLYVLKEIMGHADIKQTMSYAHLRPDTLQRAMVSAFDE